MLIILTFACVPPAAACSVDETYGVVKESEADQILRNKATIIDEIESTVSVESECPLNHRRPAAFSQCTQCTYSTRCRRGSDADKSFCCCCVLLPGGLQLTDAVIRDLNSRWV